jgi:hypothetical protein
VATPFAGGFEEALLAFDPATGLPCSYRTDRFKIGGQKLPWTAQLADWRAFGTLDYPSRIEARWADERQPCSDGPGRSSPGSRSDRRIPVPVVV